MRKSGGAQAIVFAMIVACLVVSAAARAVPAATAGLAPPFEGAADPSTIWQILLVGFLIFACLAAIIVWILTALQKAQQANRRTAAFVDAAFNNMSLGIVIVDAHHKLAFCNDAYLKLYNLDRSEMRLGMHGREMVELRRGRCQIDAEVDDLLRGVLSEDGQTTDLPDGRAILVRHRILPSGGVVSTHEDCTESRRLSGELEKTKKFLEMIIDNVPIALDVKRVKDGEYLFVNRGAEKIFNRDRETVIGLTAEEVYGRAAKLILERDSTAVRKKEQTLEEQPLQTKSGLRLFLTRRMPVLDDAGEPQYLITTHADITERRQTESRMAHMAYHDALTDLPNRAAFIQALTQMIDACDGTDEEFAVLSVDLDRLKEVNDVFGHSVGDRLLIEVSRRIQDTSQGGVVARLSGDEFGLIIDGQQPQAALDVAQSLMEAVRDEFIIDGKSVRTGVTVGVSIFPRHGSDPAALLANAGVALMRAKAKGRRSVSVFDAEIDQQIRDRRALHQDLAHALNSSQIVLHYQPQALTGHGVIEPEIIGFEALARWFHPVRGFVSPADFIPLAEESGLIVELGEWILREACREAASWSKPMQVAVNLSPAQFQHGDLVALVHSILLETGLQPGRLELEITEGVLIDDFDRGLSLLRRLKALGVRIAMDDFGSGYSSLTYLQAFPFDKIKIDRTFVLNLGRNAQSAAIIRAVIGLGHGLDISIVAEGVETQDQLTFLAHENCDQVQGYFLGKPAPIASYAGIVGEPVTPARKTG